MNIRRGNMMSQGSVGLRGASGPTGGGGSCSCSGGRPGVKSPTGGCSCSGDDSGRGSMANGGKMKYMGGGRYEGASVDDGSTGRGYAKGGKSPFYQDGGMTPGGSDVQKLLEMLSNYDQNAPIGEFLNVLMDMGGQGGAGAAAGGAGAMLGRSAMRNLPPQDVESLLMQLGQQGR